MGENTTIAVVGKGSYINGIKKSLNYGEVGVLELENAALMSEALEQVHVIFVLITSLRDYWLWRKWLPDYIEKTVIIYEKSFLLQWLLQQGGVRILEVEKGRCFTILRALLSTLCEIGLLPLDVKSILDACAGGMKSKGLTISGTKEMVEYQLFTMSGNNRICKCIFIIGEIEIGTVNELCVLACGKESKASFGCRYEPNGDLLKVFMICS